MMITKVTIRGTGQLNGPVLIYKVIEMEEQMANRFMGADRYNVISEFLKVHYPGVKINPKNIGVNVVRITTDDKPKSKKSKKKKSKSNKKVNDNLPIKVVSTVFKSTWKVLKWISKD